MAKETGKYQLSAPNKIGEQILENNQQSSSYEVDLLCHLFPLSLSLYFCLTFQGLFSMLSSKWFLEYLILSIICLISIRASQVALVVKNSCQCRRHTRSGFDLKLGRSPGGENGNPLQYLPGESLGHRSLAGYSPWGANSQTGLKRLSTQF